MKKKILSIVALCLAVCFMFAGCNLLNTNSNMGNDNAAVKANGEVLLTREEVKNAYASYFESYYNSYKEEAFDKMIDDLITEKLVYNDAKSMLESGEIVLTNTEKNYIYDQTFKAVLNNLETYEKLVAKTLGIEYEEEEEESDSQWVYTEYTPYAEVVLNAETNKYEIKLTNKYLVAKEKDGETEYEYATKAEYANYTEPTVLLSFADFKYEKLQSEDREEQVLASEARRIYLSKLLKNEEGKNLSTDEISVFNREFERIYEIVYKRFLTTKYYQTKSQSINISEEEVLTAYLAKVKETYERYKEDSSVFEKEVTTSVISANMYGQYSSGSNSIEDVWYVPADYDETFFMVYHIMVKLDDNAVARITEAKQRLSDGTISQTEYDAIVAEEYANLKLDERDEDGNIIEQEEDDKISYATMLTNLQTELAGATTAQEKGDIFNKYLYKYGTDTGSLQIQKDYFGGTHENWYGYVVGTDNKNSFLDEFVDQARALYDNGNGELASISDMFKLESWTTETKKDDNGNAIKDGDGNEVKVDKLSYAGYDVMMYGGKIVNLFECFDEEKFEITDLGENALYKLANKRLGLIGNKTLFDLVYEEIFDDLYSDLTSQLKADLNANSNIQKIESAYADLNPLK